MSRHWRPTNDDGERSSWFGADRQRPKLPYYFRTTKRLKSLDEFEPPEFVGRMGRVKRRRQLIKTAPFAFVVAVGLVIGWFAV